MDLRNKVLVGVLSSTLIGGAITWEGTRLTPYEDVVGVLTVCHGHTGSDVKWGQRYTVEQCNAMLKRDLPKYQAMVLKCVKTDLTLNQYDAFTLFTYNLGGGNFCNAGFLREFNKGNKDKACHLMATHPNGKPAWSYADGKYFQGLQNRRVFERELCLAKPK